MISISRQISQYRLAVFASAAWLFVGAGCASIANKYPVVPANRLEPTCLAPSKEALTDIPFTALGQPKPEAHVIGPGDYLSIFVYGVFPPSLEDMPLLQRSQAINQRYYPPNGNITAPSAGIPVEVDPDGSIQMPLIGSVSVEGMTVREVGDTLRDTYLREGILEQGRERITVSLMIPRVRRIVVMRQDTPAQSGALVPPGQVDHIHRGSGEVIDLPIYENDVLHALAATGGLPGTDAANEAWIIRRAAVEGQIVDVNQLADVTAGFYNHEGGSPGVIRIPLRGCPGESLPFRPEDVVLEEGDVVYLPRRDEYFYTGGLLYGAKIPLPRDEDIDVLEAIALANGSVHGPLGQGGGALAGGNPGYIIKPSKAIILRKLPNGDQLPIEVDLCNAVRDPQERICMQNGDMLLLKFRAHELILNATLNLFNPSIVISTAQ